LNWWNAHEAGTRAEISFDLLPDTRHVEVGGGNPITTSNDVTTPRPVTPDVRAVHRRFALGLLALASAAGGTWVPSLRMSTAYRMSPPNDGAAAVASRSERHDRALRRRDIQGAPGEPWALAARLAGVLRRH
jgi:hypothetical protein